MDARVHCALGGRRLEADAAALVAARTGSGKLGTPFARMHWENRRPEALVALVEVRFGWPVVPQPAIAAPQSMAMAIQSGPTRDLRIMLMGRVVRPRA